MKEKHVNEKVKIVILPTTVRATYGARESNKIQRAVMDNLLLPSKEPYHKVHVVVKHHPDGTPEAIVAYMLRAHTYTADVVKMSLDDTYGVVSIEMSYAGDEEEYPGTPLSRVPGKSKIVPDMVFGTPVPEIPSAKAGVEYVCNVVASAGYRVVKLLGKNANLANYRNYLSGHLKAFGNIGHGYTGGIVLFDGNLTSQWFASQAQKSLWPEAIYFNSCQVFNPPLQPSIMNAGARTFAGGKVNLLIGSSEEVFKCFWTKVLKAAGQMGVALRSCEKQNYPVPNAHGICGDLGKFLPIP
jgi:hypothetical protein